MHHLQDHVFGALVGPTLGIQPLPLDEIRAEYPYRIVHLADLVGAPLDRHLDRVVLFGEPADDPGHLHERLHHPSPQNEIKHGQKQRAGSRQHDLCDKAPPVAAVPRGFELRSSARARQVAKMRDRLEKRLLDPLVFGPKQAFLGGDLVSALEGLDRGLFDLVQRIRVPDDRFQRFRLARRQPLAGQPGCCGLDVPLRVLLRLKLLEVALIAAHHVEPRLVTSKLGSKRQFLGQRVERQMLLDRGAFLEGAARRHHEGATGQRGQDDRDAVGPVGDGGYSHPLILPAAV